jgi:hypothetical protein
MRKQKKIQARRRRRQMKMEARLAESMLKERKKLESRRSTARLKRSRPSSCQFSLAFVTSSLLTGTILVARKFSLRR